MNQAETLINSGDYEAAKNICDSINNIAEGDSLTGAVTMDTVNGTTWLALISLVSIIALVVVSLSAFSKLSKR